MPETIQFEFPDDCPNDSITNFFYYYTDFSELCRSVCKESIRYALQSGREFSCAPREIEVFFGIIMFMGISRLPALRDYFRTDELGQSFVRNSMSRDRFSEILRNLHFTNNLAEQSKTDKAWKVRSLIEHFNFVYQRFAANTANQSIDEHMIKFKGNNSMKQYIKNKPIKWGFKVWERCDSLSGYLYEYDLYTGRKSTPELGLGESVVLQLSSSLQDSFATLYADNYFSSPLLAKKLLESGIYFTGVVKQNRVGMPSFMKDDELERGDYQAFTSQQNAMNAVKWIDNKAVCIITTKNDCQVEETVLRRKKGQKEKVTYACPSVIKDYNQYMGGVDKHDRMTLTVDPNRRSKFRFYLRLGFNFLSQSVVNAKIAWDTIHRDEKPLSSKEFRLALCRGIISDFTSRVRAVTNEKKSINRPLQPVSDGAHLPVVIPRARCVVCYQRQKDLKTFWGCSNESCSGAWCINVNRNCFFEYHNKVPKV